MDTFTNPILGKGPDPYALFHNGFYYAMVTEHFQVALLRSADLTRLRSASRRVLYSPAAKGPAVRDLWAPELHRVEGRWRVYFTAVDESGEDRNRRIFVLSGPEGEDPFEGDWVFDGALALPVDRYAIDGTVLEDAGRRYFIWSGKLDYKGGFWQHLFIADLVDAKTLGNREVLLSRPDEAWENHDQPTNEGPQILKHGNDIWLGYSGSAFWSEHYAIGFLRAQSGSDLMDPASWTKMGRAFFKQDPTAGVFGPGHASFVKSPDGREDWLLYHARVLPRGEDRSPRLQKIAWRDQEPFLGTPQSIDTPMPKPSGSPLDH
jgi:GH43 family beta-xylosidase